MITKTFFGSTNEGAKVHEYTISDANGAYVKILDYGCTVRSLVLPDKKGELTDVCLGYDSVEEYQQNGGYFGAVIGRFANRIQGGRFTLNGKDYQLAVNDGPNHLHGGTKGFDKYIWEVKTIGEDTLCFFRTSHDGEEGYPGTLTMYVTYRFAENALSIHYEAVCDMDTVFSPTNHAYFNLNGHDSGSILDHTLQIFSDTITANDDCCLPTGELMKVEGTPFDFSSGKKIGQDIAEAHQQLLNAKGYDHNFALNNGGKLEKAAMLTGDLSGISMSVYTDRPGIQLYSGNFITDRQGKGGAEYRIRHALCLETQGYPNSTQHPHFPSPILKGNQRFCSDTVYRFE